MELIQLKDFEQQHVCFENIACVGMRRNFEQHDTKNNEYLLFEGYLDF